MEPVLFETKGAVGWLTLNRPESRNALSLDLMESLQNHLNLIAKNRDIHVLVIKGNGPCFSAGHNLKEMSNPQNDIHYFRKVFSVCTQMMQTFHDLPQPVIAQVHGIATAAGCQLVAACDLAIAETGAKFSTPGVKIGLFCSTPMVPLCRVIGRRRALEMLLTGSVISAKEACQFGLVNKLAEPEKLAEETEKWANEIAKSSLFILEFGKKGFYVQVDQDEVTAYNYAKEIIAINALAEDAKEGINAFIEKREPKWKDK